MGDWKEQTKVLLETVKESKEYQEYSHYKEAVMANPELAKTVNEYRRESFAIQLHDKENWLNHYEQVRMKYENALMVKEVKKFLTAETKLCRIYRTIMDTICEENGVDIGFLDQL